MLNTIKGLLGLQPPADFWFMDQSAIVQAFVLVQLEEAARTEPHTWRNQAPFILGYVCGASEHLCVQQNMRKRTADLSTIVVADLIGTSFKAARDTLVKLQHPMDSSYLEAHRVGWHDWGMRRHVSAEGLVDLLRQEIGPAPVSGAQPHPKAQLNPDGGESVREPMPDMSTGDGTDLAEHTHPSTEFKGGERFEDAVHTTVDIVAPQLRDTDYAPELSPLRGTQQVRIYSYSLGVAECLIDIRNGGAGRRIAALAALQRLDSASSPNDVTSRLSKVSHDGPDNEAYRAGYTDAQRYLSRRPATWLAEKLSPGTKG